MQIIRELTEEEREKYDEAVQCIKAKYSSNALIARAFYDASGIFISDQTVRNWFVNRSIIFENALIFCAISGWQIDPFVFNPYVKEALEEAESQRPTNKTAN